MARTRLPILVPLPFSMLSAFTSAVKDTNARNYVEFWRALNGAWFPHLASDSKLLLPDQIDSLPRKVQCELGRWVDCWIKSGFEGIVEKPFNRSLSDTQMVSIDLYFKSREVRPSITARAGSNLDERYSFLADPATSLPPETKRDCLETKRESEGRLREHSALDVGLNFYTAPQKGEDLDKYSANVAVRLFLTLLDSGGMRFRIMRCGKCSRYEFVEPRPQYKRGWHCQDHSKSVATESNTYLRREGAQERRLNLAAEAYNSREKLVWRNGEREVYIATRMNKNESLDLADHRRRNWVTLHWDEIVREAKRLKAKRRKLNGSLQARR